MDIAVHGDFDGTVSQYFADTLIIAAFLHTVCGKRMTQAVKFPYMEYLLFPKIFYKISGSNEAPKACLIHSIGILFL